MNGDEAIRQIRAMGWEVPIIALTGNAFDEERKNMYAVGATAFLGKPTSAAILKNTIEEIFQNS